MRREKKPRVSARDWVEIALTELSSHGPDAITIDALCRRAGKTKGSFYAHFDSFDAFLAALATHWRARNTETVMRDADAAASPRDRLARLNAIAVRLDARLDQGMRKLAGKSPLIAAAVAKVDEMRIAYLARLHQAAGGFPARAAKDLATIEYAAYVGLPLIGPERGLDELERLHRTFTRLISRPRHA
ncbi:TetR/AcrR family transcriptional regulator [Dongia sp.]|uniref:TetR/AcrR family transcriptional regulator n=1 Tax=Dongia sp. TaxID=1977262 RepID=UPI0035B4F725